MFSKLQFALDQKVSITIAIAPTQNLAMIYIQLTY